MMTINTNFVSRFYENHCDQQEKVSTFPIVSVLDLPDLPQKGKRRSHCRNCVRAVIGMLLEHIKKQNKIIGAQGKRIAELEKRLSITPQNSSLPPSTQHPHAKTSSHKPKRKRGGQKGHKKNQRKLVPIDQIDAGVVGER